MDVFSTRYVYCQKYLMLQSLDIQHQKLWLSICVLLVGGLEHEFYFP